MPQALYMIIEHFKNKDPVPVYGSAGEWRRRV